MANWFRRLACRLGFHSLELRPNRISAVDIENDFKEGELVRGLLLMITSAHEPIVWKCKHCDHEERT